MPKFKPTKPGRTKDQRLQKELGKSIRKSRNKAAKPTKEMLDRLDKDIRDAERARPPIHRFKKTPGDRPSTGEDRLVRKFDPEVDEHFKTINRRRVV